MIVIAFPGQGSQYVGMGQKLENLEYFDQANDVLGFNLKELCFNGPIEELTLTENTQPAILTHSFSLYKELTLNFPSLKIDLVLGHSVGEYAALVAANVFSFEDAIQAVHLRGKYMQAAVPKDVGAMIAIIKVPSDIVAKACTETSTADNRSMVANYNELNQTVISGHKEACSRAVEWLKQNHEQSFRAIPLKVSAPFHSSLMKPAEVKLAEHFKTISFNENQIAVLTNIDAEKNNIGTSGKIFKQKLTEQVSGSVRWQQSILKLPENSLIIEVGPGKVLTGLIKKIRSDIKVITLDTENSFEELKDYL